MSASIVANNIIPANWREIWRVMLKLEYAAAIAATMRKLVARSSNLDKLIFMSSEPLFMSSEPSKLDIDKITEMLGYNPTLYNYDPVSIKPYTMPGATPEEAEKQHADNLEHNKLGDADSVFIDAYSVKIGDKEFLLVVRMFPSGNSIAMSHITYRKDGMCDYQGNTVSTQTFRDDFSDVESFFNDDARCKRFSDDFNPITNAAHHLLLAMIDVVDHQLAEKLRK
jgi:hypothetical protein